MIMTNKLVIRRLPPSMSEDEFLRQVSPLPDHDYFCFLEANTSLGSHSFSRAYINFLSPDDASIFREQLDNYVFLDRTGHEYPAVVEQALWHKSPKDGPFYKLSAKPQEHATGLEQDPDYIEFLEKIKSPKRKNRQSPIQTLETNLDAITSNNSPSGKKGNSMMTTPLIGYVNQKRLMKNAKKGR